MNTLSLTLIIQYLTQFSWLGICSGCGYGFMDVLYGDTHTAFAFITPLYMTAVICIYFAIKCSIDWLFIQMTPAATPAGSGQTSA